MAEADLSDLIARARVGDTEAFGQLVERFSGAVRAMCVLRAADPQQADDISQQVFLTAWKRMPELGSDLAFWPWLEAITRNYLSNEWRRVQRERGFRQRYTVAWLARSETEDGTPEDAESLAQEMASLRACLKGLPSRLQEMVKLRYEQGFSSEKIAAQLGQSADSVRQAFVRLRDKLRDCMAHRQTKENAV